MLHIFANSFRVKITYHIESLRFIPYPCQLLLADSVFDQFLINNVKSFIYFQCTIIKTLLIIGTLCHTSTMLASSFIEEEHQTWYFLTVSINSVLCVIFIKTYATGIVALTKLPESPSNYIKVTSCLNLSSSIDEDNDDEVSFEKDKAGDNSEKNLRNRKDKSVFKYDGNTSVDDAGCQNRNTPSDILKGAVFCVVSLGLCRIARDWNRTGDKWAHLPDIGDWLVRCVLVNIVYRWKR